MLPQEAACPSKSPLQSKIPSSLGPHPLLWPHRSNWVLQTYDCRLSMCFNGNVLLFPPTKWLRGMFCKNSLFPRPSDFTSSLPTFSIRLRFCLHKPFTVTGWSWLNAYRMLVVRQLLNSAWPVGQGGDQSVTIPFPG